MINISIIFVWHLPRLRSPSFPLSNITALLEHHNLNLGDLIFHLKLSGLPKPPPSNTLPSLVWLPFIFYPLWRERSHPSEWSTYLFITHIDRIFAAQIYEPRTISSCPSIPLLAHSFSIVTMPLPFLVLTRKYHVHRHWKLSRIITLSRDILI